MLLTSHYMRDVEALCQRVLVISHGKVVYDGPLTGISEQFGSMKLLHLQFADGVLASDPLNQVVRPRCRPTSSWSRTATATTSVTRWPSPGGRARRW